MASGKRTTLNEIRCGDGSPLILRWTDLIYAAVIGVISILCLELFHRMIVVYHDVYHSDIGYYVRSAKDDSLPHWKRLIEYVFSKLYAINQDTMELNIYLALVIAAIIVVNFLVIRFYLKEDGVLPQRQVIQLFSVTALFMAPIYVPEFHEFFYRFSFDCFAWHSPTQQSMILFSMIASLCFLKMFLEYDRKGLCFGWWIASAVCIFLSAWAKPSFFMDLAVTVVILFVIELIIGGKDGIVGRFLRLFIMGCSLIPAGLYVILLNRMEYNSGESKDQVVIGFVNGFAQSHMKAGFLCGLAFAIVVCAVNLKLLADRKYRFAGCILLTGILQWLFISEVGPSAKYGNFSWGRDYGDYFILLISVTILLRNWYQRDTLFKGSKVLQALYFLVAGALLALHLISGLVYFYLVLTGHGYYI